jgi:putative tryptophan/tyrosine transport system substrate-binding protein
LRYFIHLIAILALMLPSLAEAYEVLIVQSSRSSAYEEVLKGFRSIRRSSERVIVLSDYAEVDMVRIVREDQPRLILALGDQALKATKPIRQTPIIGMMALGIHEQQATRPNLTGVGMFIAPKPYLDIFQSMNARRVGVVYSAAKSDWFLRQARREARDNGIELVLREVASPQQTMSQLASLAGKVDAIWMLPDSIAVTRESMEAYFRFSHDKRIPLVSFASAYLGLGAAAVLELDRIDLGRQAGEMAATISGGRPASSLSLNQPRKAVYRTNPSVLNKLDLWQIRADTATISVLD